MKIDEQRLGAVLVIKPNGPLVGADAEHFRSRLLQALDDVQGRFVLDASAIAFVDSKGLEALVEVNDQMSATGRAMKICNATETVRQVLRMTGLAGIFEYFEEVTTAIRSFL
ncbi:MAG: hypothetical protein AMK72_09985 [Planctomycetes bacterium SM23_25]|nr:MAG: hypothetical protein AMK72_09985 [Planctomycetes bacterium SM23_25]